MCKSNAYVSFKSVQISVLLKWQRGCNSFIYCKAGFCSRTIYNDAVVAVVTRALSNYGHAASICVVCSILGIVGQSLRKKEKSKCVYAAV